MSKTQRTALITGASSGLGMELARLHAQNGDDLVLVARSVDKMQVLKDELEKQHGTTVTFMQKVFTNLTPFIPKKVLMKQIYEMQQLKK